MTDGIEAGYDDDDNFRLLRDDDGAGGEADDYIGDNGNRSFDYDTSADDARVCHADDND